MHPQVKGPKYPVALLGKNTTDILVALLDAGGPPILQMFSALQPIGYIHTLCLVTCAGHEQGISAKLTVEICEFGCVQFCGDDGTTDRALKAKTRTMIKF